MSKNGVTVKVDVDLLQACNARLTERVRLFAANEAFRLMTPYVPMDTGMLSQTVDIQPGEVHYKVPYAHKQYTGDNFRFSKEKHSLATAHWAEAMMEARGDDLARAVENYIKSGRS